MKITIADCQLGYSNKVILKIDKLHFESGRINLIIASNGEGKTTLIKAVANLLLPINGTITKINPEKVSYVSAESNLSDLHMSSSQYFNLMTDINAPSINMFDKSFELLNKTLPKLVLNLSTGMKQLLKLSAVCLDGKDIYIWDEPLKSLAPETRKKIVEFLDNISKDKIVIVSDHSSESWKGSNVKIFNLVGGEIIEYN